MGDMMGEMAAAEEKYKKFENLKRFCAKHWLTRKIFFCVYRCGKCGKKLNVLSFNELPGDLQNEHLKAGTDWAFRGSAYICPDKCEGEYMGYLIT